MEELTVKERLLGLFSVAGINVLLSWELVNQYWPDAERFNEIRNKNPWLLIKTPYGLVTIGWRKNVIEIRWEHKLAEDVTLDDVTKSKTYVHAWSYSKAIEYLLAWKAQAASAQDAAFEDWWNTWKFQWIDEFTEEQKNLAKLGWKARSK